MARDGAKRSCAVCNRSVYDLSVLTRRQAVELLDNNAGKLCGRIAHDECGNQIFVRERGALERLIQISVLGASAVASAAAAPSCEVKVSVVDPVGSIIPRAALRIAGTAGAEIVSSGVSDDRGEFSGQVAPGIYSLQVEAAGFATFRRELICKESETLSVAAPLQIGLTGEVVMIEPARPTVLARLRSFLRRL